MTRLLALVVGLLLLAGPAAAQLQQSNPTVTLGPGSSVIGHVIVDSSGVVHVVIDSSAVLAVTNANLDAALSTLATASGQTTTNSALSSIDGKITAVNTGAVVIASGTTQVTQATATSLKAQAEAYQGGTAVSGSNPLQVSIANTGANGTAVKVDGSAVTQPVSGTFYQVTQPVSIASMPSTPVTGTFWQTTQPVSLASAPTTAVTNASLDGTTIATLDADVKANVTLHAGTNVIGHVIVDTAPSTAVTNANLDVALSTLATASAQTTGNNSLSTIATNTGNGATSANQTTELASLATIAGAVHNEDAPAVDGEAGIKMLGRRNDANATLTSADGDEGGIVVDPHGHLVTKLAGRDAAGNENLTTVSPGGAVLTMAVPTRLAWPCNALRRTNCR